MRIDAEMTTYLTRNLKNNEVCGALTKNGRLTAQKKKKYQYKYSTRRKTFSSIIQAQSIEINPTEIKTLVEKGMMLGLEKRNENRRPNRGNHSRSRSRSETRNSNNRRDKSKALKGFYFHQEITRTEAQEVKPRIFLKNMVNIKEHFSKRWDNVRKILNYRNHN